MLQAYISTFSTQVSLQDFINVIYSYFIGLAQFDGEDGRYEWGHRDATGETTLGLVAKLPIENRYKRELIELFLRHGCDLNQTDRSGFNLLTTLYQNTITPRTDTEIYKFIL